MTRRNQHQQVSPPADQQSSPCLVLDLDLATRQAAILEAVALLDQALALPHVQHQVRDLVRRSRLRLSYYYRHSHAGSRVASHKLALLDAHHPDLGKSLSLVPERSHSLHHHQPLNRT